MPGFNTTIRWVKSRGRSLTRYVGRFWLAQSLRLRYKRLPKVLEAYVEFRIYSFGPDIR